jgi:methionyl-tRNA synthetase
MSRESYYVTTPIYYINDVPHVGHAYTTYAADTLARYYRARNRETFFLTGTDENSQKTVEAATAAGTETVAFTDTMSKRWVETWQRLGIECSRFIRTTEPEHRKAVEKFLKKLEASGAIHKGVYEGWYCEACEEFKRDEDLTPDGCCPLHPNRKVKRLSEENYFFALSRYQHLLLEHYREHPDFVQPPKRMNEVRRFVEGGLADLSVSRAGRTWGIPLPMDPTHRVYVWVDALINYLTGVGYAASDRMPFWPADAHLIGKDIVKFHAVIWPAMLMAAGVALPKAVVAHGFFTVDGQKISKSLGNAIDPLVLADKYGSDALRYFLLREIPFGSDGDFSEAKLKERYTADLANGFGNLLSRVSTMIAQYLDGGITGTPGEEIQTTVGHLRLSVETLVERYQFSQVLEACWKFIAELDGRIQTEKPWELAKAKDRRKLTHVLAELHFGVTELTKLLGPFLPQTTAKALVHFTGKRVTKVPPLFPRLT